MNENRPDPELIAALTAGDLPPEEAARAEASLDPEARAELAVQRSARQALEGLPSPRLSAAEQQRLRRRVRNELRLEAPASRSPERSRRTGFPRSGALPVLTAFASLVVVLAIALNTADRGEFESAPTTASDTDVFAPATTTAASAAATTTTARSQAQAAVVTSMVTQTEIVEAEADAMAAAEEAVEEVTMLVVTSMVDTVEIEITEDQASTTAAAGALESSDTTALPAGTESGLFDFSTAGPSEAVRLISEAVAEGSSTAFPVSELVDRAGSEGMACGETAASASAPDGVVYFMARGFVDGEDAEAYLLVEGRPIDLAAGIEPGDVLLFSLPDCRAMEFTVR